MQSKVARVELLQNLDFFVKVPKCNLHKKWDALDRWVQMVLVRTYVHSRFANVVLATIRQRDRSVNAATVIKWTMCWSKQNK